MATGRQALQHLAVLALAACAAGPAGAQPRAVAPVRPALMEIGPNRDGGLTYIAHGYAPATAALSSLAGSATGDFSFRVGGYCLDSSEVSLVPTGVAGNTTAWSYILTEVTGSLVEDPPAGSCRYTVRVNYELSLTGSVTINQVEYTVYLKGRAPGATGLSVIP